MTRSVFFWRRTDMDGLERLELETGEDGISATSSVLCLEAGGCRIDHRWKLDAGWSVQSVVVERWNMAGPGLLSLDRAGNGWLVNGERRLEFDGAQEPDLSITPFCNTFPIRRMSDAVGPGQPVDVVYIDGPALTVRRSRQRYDRQGPNRLRYVDLGLSNGFEADLLVDDDGLIVHYEHLFERITPPA